MIGGQEPTNQFSDSCCVPLRQGRKLRVDILDAVLMMSHLAGDNRCELADALQHLLCLRQIMRVQTVLTGGHRCGISWGAAWALACLEPLADPIENPVHHDALNDRSCGKPKYARNIGCS